MNEHEGLGGLFRDVSTMLLGFAIAVFFGLVKEARDYTMHPTPTVQWKIVVLKMVIAGASGLVVTWLTLEWQVGKYLAGVLVAIAGYAGAEVLDIVKEAAYAAVKRKLRMGGAPEDAAHLGPKD